MGSSKKKVEDLQQVFGEGDWLGYDPVTGKFDAPDEWWDRKIAVSCDQILVLKHCTV